MTGKPSLRGVAIGGVQCYIFGVFVGHIAPSAQSLAKFSSVLMHKHQLNHNMQPKQWLMDLCKDVPEA